MDALKIGEAAFLAEAIGLAVGVLNYYLLNFKNSKIMGMLLGGASGLMLAIICFDILPESLKGDRIDLTFVGMAIGCLLGLLLDDAVPNIESRFKLKVSTMRKMAIVLALGIAIHNIPEGFAFGTLTHASTESMGKLVFILGLHSIPEGIALAMPFKNSGVKLPSMMCIVLVLGSLMGIGGILGFLLSEIYPKFLTTTLGIAAGIILYIVYEELMPESKKMWNGRLTTVAAIIGLMLGLLLIH